MVDKISVVIPTKNSGTGLSDLLDKIYSQDIAPSIDLEIIIVDSGSTDETIKIAKEYDTVLVKIDPGEFHHAATRNLGAEHATGDVLIFAVQDMRPKNDNWLRNLISPLKNPKIGVVYSRQVPFPDAKPMDMFFYSYFYPDKRQLLTIDDLTDERKFYLNNVYISDVSAAMKKTVWEEIQFSTEHSMSEDKKFAIDALRSGYHLVYEPTSVVFHSHDYTLSSLFHRRYKDGMAYAEIPKKGQDTYISNGFEYLFEELKYLVSTGHLYWIPYAIIYETTHFIAFQIGKNKKKHMDR